MADLQLAQAADAYLDRTAASRQAHQAAERCIPGGVSRQTLAFPPYPFYATSASGALVTDVDGNSYVDFVNNFTSLIHGHGFGPVVEAAHRAVPVAAIGTPHPDERSLAELLADRLPGLEWLHFTTTGSEAVTYALRVARAATSRSRVLAFEGGFHGSANEMVRDVTNAPLPAGSAVPARAQSAGLEPTSALTAVYNDRESVTHAFRTWGHEIAAVILEPFLGNAALIEARPDFVAHVFDVAHRHGALVVFDEVQALRLGYHGLHGTDGWAPDLVAVGKIMGGGFPLAAYGGRRDLASVLEGPKPALVQTGTFTGAPIALGAGLAAMTHLTQDSFAGLDALGERLREGVRRALRDAGVVAHVNGRGSMFNVSINDQPVNSYRTHRSSDVAMLRALHDELLVRGVLVMPRGTGCLSTAHDSDHVDRLVTAVAESLAAVQSQ